MVMKKSDESAPKAETTELEFPDWSGMIDSSKRVNVETAFEMVELYRKWFPRACRQRQSQPPAKCLVEFVL
jgi:hypothetical protein